MERIRNCNILVVMLQVSAPQPADIRRIFRVFVFDMGINKFAVQTWVSVALVAMWAAFVVSGLLALDKSTDMVEAVSKTSAKKKTPLMLSLAQTIHQVLHSFHALSCMMMSTQTGLHACCATMHGGTMCPCCGSNPIESSRSKRINTQNQ